MDIYLKGPRSKSSSKVLYECTCNINIRSNLCISTNNIMLTNYIITSSTNNITSSTNIIHLPYYM